MVFKKEGPLERMGTLPLENWVSAKGESYHEISAERRKKPRNSRWEYSNSRKKEESPTQGGTILLLLLLLRCLFVASGKDVCLITSCGLFLMLSNGFQNLLAVDPSARSA